MDPDGLLRRLRPRGRRVFVHRDQRSRVRRPHGPRLRIRDHDVRPRRGPGLDPVRHDPALRAVRRCRRNGQDDGWRTPDPGGLQFWINHTNDPSWGRDKVAYNFYQSEEARKDRVQAMYHVLLNREPDSVGWPFWTQRVLTTGDIALAYNIANSDEYFARAQTRY